MDVRLLDNYGGNDICGSLDMIRASDGVESSVPLFEKPIIVNDGRTEGAAPCLAQFRDLRGENLWR